MIASENTRHAGDIEIQIPISKQSHSLQMMLTSLRRFPVTHMGILIMHVLGGEKRRDEKRVGFCVA